MRKTAESFYKNLLNIFPLVKVTDKENNILDFYEGIERASSLVISQADSGHKLMFIGNGASAAISSHMATDFGIHTGIRAMAFNDSVLLTCVSNDYSFQHVFEKPIEMFADQGDILFAISSSGESENILLGVKAAKAKSVEIITLSGFDENNPLRKTGEVNFYVPASQYGYVEVIHHSLCHCLLDIIIKNKQKLKDTAEGNE